MKNFLNQELIENNINCITLHIKNYHPFEYQKIIEQTNYLSKDCRFTERIYQIINDLKEIQMCIFCKKNTISFSSLTQGYKKYCSFSCEQKNRPTEVIIKWAENMKKRWAEKTPEQINKTVLKTKETKLKKYGDENYTNLEKGKETNLEKYGVENPFQADEFKKKSEQTKLEKYGDKNYNNIGKGKETKLEKYGDKNYNNIGKGKETKLEKYGDKNYSNIEKGKETKLINNFDKILQSDKIKNDFDFLSTEYKGTKTKIKDKIKRHYYIFKCKKCGKILTTTLADGHIPRCRKCFPKSTFTKPHKSICEYLEEQNIKFEIEKYIKPYYVDIFIEPNKIIEVYGDYWHANPEIYKEDKPINYFGQEILTKDIWQKDENRIKYLENKNNKILILWEKEIKDFLLTTKEKLKNFIK